MANSLHESMDSLKSLTMYLNEKEDKKNEKPTICEEDVKDEKSFREYAEKVLKEMWGDEYDEDKAKETIDGIIADKKDDEDWGTLIGKLNK